MGLFVAYSVVFPYLGIEKGSKLSMPSNTFVATANMAIAAKYVPNPIDTDSDGILRNTITHVSVTYSGNPDPQGLVGDDAHYLMRGMGDRPQLVSVISTHAIKPITTGEGGVVLTNHQSLYEQMKEMVDHGRGQHVNGFGFGYNFRMPSLNAALGISQLEQADRNLGRRQEIAKLYSKELKDIPYLTVQEFNEASCYHLYPVTVKSVSSAAGKNVFSVELFQDYLYQKGIGTQKHYPSLDSYDHISGDTVCLKARDYYRSMVSIPMSAAMTIKDAETVITAIKNYFGAK